MTSINAGIPKALAEGVREAQTRGQEDEPTEPKLGDTPVIDESFASNDTVCRPPVPAPAPVRRRRGVARLRSAAASRRSEGSPTGAAGMRRQLHLQPVAGPSSRPFVTQGSSSSSSDPFGISIREDPPLRTPQLDPSSDDESTNSADQENDSILSPTKPRQTPRKFAGTPRRPQGAPPVPLGELTLEDDSPSESEAEVGPQPEPEVEEPSPPSSPSSASVEEEYPPSPRKSPSKSPAKKMPVPSSSSNPFFQSQAPGVKPQHRSTTALFGPGARNFTPPNGLARPLASDSPYIAYAEGDDTTMAEPSPSPRKARTGGLFQLPAKKSEVPAARTLFGRPAGGAGAGFGSINGKTAAASVNTGAVRKSQRSSKSQSPPSSAEKRRMRDKRLWDLCGGDVRKWNRGDFGAEEGFAMKAARW